MSSQLDRMEEMMRHILTGQIAAQYTIAKSAEYQEWEARAEALVENSKAVTSTEV